MKENKGVRVILHILKPYFWKIIINNNKSFSYSTAQLESLSKAAEIDDRDWDPFHLHFVQLVPLEWPEIRNQCAEIPILHIINNIPGQSIGCSCNVLKAKDNK